MVAEGHELGNHSWDHKSYTSMSLESMDAELKKTNDAIVAATGVRPRVMRPPYGAFNKTLSAYTYRTYGYKTILWDVDPLDWKNRNAATVTSRIVSAARSGSIILSHDIHATTVDAMPGTIKQLKAAGYRFVTVSQLIAIGNRERLSALEKKRALEASKNDEDKLAKLAPLKPSVPAAPYQIPRLARKLPVSPLAPDLSSYSISAPAQSFKVMQVSGE